MDQPPHADDCAPPSRDGRRSFQELCETFKRNDPSATVANCRVSSTIPHAYGRRLGTALQGNTVVSKIALNLAYLLSKTDRQAGTTNSATPLLKWMVHSPTLRTVTLNYHFEWFIDKMEPVEHVLLERIMRAVAQNERIQELDSHVPDFPLRLATDFLLTVSSRLETLRMSIHLVGTDAEYQAAALAMSALSSLRELKLHCNERFLRLLPPRVTGLLTDLFVEFSTPQDGTSRTGSSSSLLFSTVLTSSTRLQVVTIQDLDVDEDVWTSLELALSSNQSIVRLEMGGCRFSKEATTLFLNDIQSNNATRQHIRELSMCGCSLKQSNVIDASTQLAGMLRGSLLRTLFLDGRTLETGNWVSFFNVLTNNTSTVTLKSLEIYGTGNDMVQGIGPYLRTAVHLCHLSMQVHGYDYCRQGMFVVPAAFLWSLRRNASLQTVEFVDKRYHKCVGDGVAADRWIAAFARRNRELPELMTLCFSSAVLDSSTDCASPSLFPTLCFVSQQAKRMAGNTVLRGLLAAGHSLGAKRGSRRCRRRSYRISARAECQF